MKKAVAVLLLQLLCFSTSACTVYKITMHGCTFVGNNEDYSYPHTRLWFEAGKNGSYGAMYVGYDNMFAQGGMNEHGLVFDGFSVKTRPHMCRTGKPAYQGNTIKHIMQQCRNVAEVCTIMNRYDRTDMLEDGMMLFIDADGRYLVVEADTLIMGSDSTYLLSNFCPSVTPCLDSVPLSYYQKGRVMMQQRVDTSLSYLASLSDTMHQAKAGNMGGTLYTTIYDLAERKVHLYFYHDYTTSVTYSLQDALHKSDTVIAIPNLFSANTAGQAHLRKYNKTKWLVDKLSALSFASDTNAFHTLLHKDGLTPYMHFFEEEINDIGYGLLKQKQYQAAINVFLLNTQSMPGSWNAYDSLGDAYMQAKQYKDALTAYQRSLALNAGNDHARKQISRINKKQQ